MTIRLYYIFHLLFSRPLFRYGLYLVGLGLAGIGIVMLSR